MDAEVSEIGMKVLFLLIPGIITLNIVRSMGPKTNRSDFESGLQIFVYGAVSYALSGIGEGLYSWAIDTTSARQNLITLMSHKVLFLATVNSDTDISTVPLFSSTLISIIVGILISVDWIRSIPHRIMRFLNLTKRTSEVDVWNFTLNSPDIDNWLLFEITKQAKCIRAGSKHILTAMTNASCSLQT